MEKLIKSAALSTPDPERAFKNLSTFCDNNPEGIEKLEAHLGPISLLFSYSQFLSVFCVSNPDILFDILADINTPLNREILSASLKEQFENNRDHMKVVRKFKKKELLRITLRDILKKSDLIETMLELSMLADTIINESLKVLKKTLNETYGEPEKDAFTVISLGKLGSEELNFSSDVDLILVYGTSEGETSGVITPQGITANRISNHEYYCKLGENLNRFLSMNTEDGFAYRVDLRLRPEGQRGSLALPLSGYETYYESWGRAWERVMLLRARPVAGDLFLGNEFLDMIKPFVYRKYLDYSAIDEIRQIKTRIDSIFKKNDIKRGYGGIREIEFFIQALQLIYAGKEPLLRERGTQKALHRLLQKNLIGQADYAMLSDNYTFLRTLEHRLQQLNDLQTHSLPSDEKELTALSRKMGFPEKASFLSELELRRNKTRTIYDSLFREDKKELSDGVVLFDEELSDIELKEHLGKIGLKDVEKGLRNIQHIRDASRHFQTLRGRRVLSEILPVFVDAAVKSSNPDMALNHLQAFASMLSLRESYLDIFKENKDLVPVLINLFSQSEYLSKAIIRKPDYLELIGHEIVLKKSLNTLKDELKKSDRGGQALSDAMRIMRQVEEIRLSLLFLQKKIDVTELIKGLSKTAEAILSASVEELGGNLAIVGFGKLGGREITFNSDIDIIFASPDNVKEEQTKIAEKLLRLLLSYTREGIAYKVDTRLRPDGTKGTLVSSVNALRDYYSGNAAFWEFQALLKARPVAGDIKTGKRFIDMAKDILIKHGHMVSASDTRAMRERIQKELAKETEGYDIKLGFGGLEELEFTVQYLQLKNCNKFPSLLVQGTLDAIGRLEQSGIINKSDADFMKKAYVFYRTIESYLRLREKDILKKDEEEILNAVSEFWGLKNKEELIEKLDETRAKVRDIYNLLVV
ncbi:MAG: bifunctional [glutamate--ammonia ligase]-adenylyl-L-tyrosine phosphorylase/[glutamate--ammonia-ligase] adenylyltransferase [Thermodesulfovibrionales bacterium]|nr:bifunctional [glutamate--ammonia ligase]-adenylyl-L-tyrosine phosphorylase/[glutamate--ammonia-ligase] adenylyltransferase [Thermodesulfovibrionales bacterium]